MMYKISISYIDSEICRSWGKKNDYYNYHREEDKPAFETSLGYKAWWNKGRRHRKGGPALIHVDGTYEYWINGKEIINET